MLSVIAPMNTEERDRVTSRIISCVRTRAGLLALLPMLVVVGLAACTTTAAPGADGLSVGAPTAGVLRILGSANEEYVRGVVRTFQEETGIRTTYERQSA